MRELLDIIRANPFPFGAGLLVVLLMIMAENFGRGIHGGGRGDGGDFPGSDGGHGEGGDGGGD